MHVVALVKRVNEDRGKLLILKSSLTARRATLPSYLLFAECTYDLIG
jgi:hypothetical protein